MYRWTKRLGMAVGLAMLTGCSSPNGIWTPSYEPFTPPANELSPRDQAISTLSGGLADVGPLGTGTANALLPLTFLAFRGEGYAPAFVDLRDLPTSKETTAASIARMMARQVPSLPGLPSGSWPINFTDDLTGLTWTGQVTFRDGALSVALVGTDGVHRLNVSLDAHLIGNVVVFNLAINGSYVGPGEDLILVDLTTGVQGQLSSLDPLVGGLSGQHAAAVEVRDNEGNLLLRSTESLNLDGWVRGNNLGLEFSGNSSIGEQMPSGLWWVRTQAALSFASNVPDLPLRQANLGMTLHGEMHLLAANGMAGIIVVDNNGAVSGRLTKGNNIVAVISGSLLTGVTADFGDGDVVDIGLWFF